MEIDNLYYKKIIYKKNAYDDLKTYLKINYLNKKILLLSTNSTPTEEHAYLLNVLFNSASSVEQEIIKDNYKKTDLDQIYIKIKQSNINLIVAFGDETVCEISKYMAYVFKIEYIVCPVSATSLSYFNKYCINPYDPTKSFYANFANKIFIQDSLIKNSNCLNNINGLCCMHSMREVLLEGIINSNEKEKYIFIGMEKTFDKLDNEQTNILLCEEDSNLILMDLLIDLAFYVSMLDCNNYLIFNLCNVYMKISATNNVPLSGTEMLLCTKSALSLMVNYLKIASCKCLEKNNYGLLSQLIDDYDINYQILKNDLYFKNNNLKTYEKIQFLSNKDYFLQKINDENAKISSFCKTVKNIYKYGIEIDGQQDVLFNALRVAPFICGSTILIDYIADSGILNAL